MKKLILLFFACSYCWLAQAQVHPQPDSSRTGYKPGNHGTDSVKSGHQIFQGGKGSKGKPKGDTLQRRGNKSGMRQEHGTPRSSPTGGDRPKYLK